MYSDFYGSALLVQFQFELKGGSSEKANKVNFCRNQMIEIVTLSKFIFINKKIE
jgi:hypothetical protein